MVLHTKHRLGVSLLAGLWILAVAPVWAVPSYEELAKHYEYDPTMPLDPEVALVRDAGEATVNHVVFSSTNGERVPALVAIPKKGDGPFPALVLLHGYTGSKDDWDKYQVFDLIAGQGVVCIAIDAQLHGERKVEGKDMYDPKDLRSGLDAMIQTIVDCRRAVDYVLTLGQVDPQRIGFVGGSMGAILGAVFCAVEPRVSCCVLVVGGADWGVMVEKSMIGVALRARAAEPIDPDQVREALAPVDPLHFVGHISPRPVLFQNGTKDIIVPVEANKLLIEACGEPKEVDWYDAGHALPPLKLIPRVFGWLQAHLGFGPGAAE
ncbi:MAG TPA: alpha/beta fold hydrolase [Armatimonadota bacterium]|nr:alpha/beta fold hydrolase [Armatimonadota bacterium]